MEVIVPCAGKSSRFPNVRPKYLLTDFENELMVKKAVGNLLADNQVTVVILREHVEKYDAQSILAEAFQDCINIVVLEQETPSPAHTVAKALELMNTVNKPILVRDCDSFFHINIKPGNIVYTSKLSVNKKLSNVSSLGYVVQNEHGVIDKLMEKEVISDNFCAGAYQFSSAELFLESFQRMKDQPSELYLSNIIDDLILNGHIFLSQDVGPFESVGTLQSWLAYNDRPTIFCDIDGVIIMNQSAYGKNRYSESSFEILKENVNILKTFKSLGAQLIFATSRPTKYHQITRTMLDRIGFEDCQLIMGLNHSKRILINDFADTNPFPSAVSINIPRNSTLLSNHLQTTLLGKI